MRQLRASDASEQDQDQQDDDDQAETAAAIIARAIERPAADARKAAEQRDHENDQDDSSDRHDSSSAPAGGRQFALPSPRKPVGTSKVPRALSGKSRCGFPAAANIDARITKTGLIR